MADCRDESVDCRVDRAIYDAYADLKVVLESDINKIAGQTNNANNTAIGAGTVACAAGAVVMMTTPVGWLLAVGLVVVAAGSAVSGYNVGKGVAKDQELTRLREACKKYLETMIQYRNKAKEDCRNPECVPPMPAACP